MQNRLSSDKVTREDLKEILQVNIELFRDEPEFYEYLTTLVIYLMKYEFVDDEPPKSAAKPAQPSWRQVQQLNVDPIPGSVLHERLADHRCPHCHNEVPYNKRICSYCLALIRDES